MTSKFSFHNITLVRLRACVRYILLSLCEFNMIVLSQLGFIVYFIRKKLIHKDKENITYSMI